VGDTVVASPVRVPVVTWTKGAIEVSHQGVAIGSAYAGTTRIVAMMASGPGNNANLVGSAAQAELRDVGTLQGKTRAEIENMLQQRGYTAVENNAKNGWVWTKSHPDGSTAAVRIDPGNINLPQGYAGRVAHAHKEIVPSAKVVNGNYDPRFATKLDDLGNQSSNPYSIHIGIIW
jgi:ABC-type nitrate/sulfonate/bicarbonate transport system substrate-binding protein